MGIGGGQYFMSLTSKWVWEMRDCHSAIEVFGGGGAAAGTGSNWNDALFPLTAARARGN